jgi:secondary thiamine-phosphate synthase enzyme
VHEIPVQSQRRTQLIDITDEVREVLSEELRGASAVLVYVPHTTAGVTINEHADPAVARDLEAALERIVDNDWGWQHVEAGEANAPSHVRASFAGPQVVVPVVDGKLGLGTWQGIFFCEFDGPRRRRVYVAPLG